MDASTAHLSDNVQQSVREHDADPAAHPGLQQKIVEVIENGSVAEHNADASAHQDIRSNVTNLQTSVTNIQNTADGAVLRTGDTMTGDLIANNPAVGAKAVRNIYAGTGDLIAGTSQLDTGVLYFVYE